MKIRQSFVSNSSSSSFVLTTNSQINTKEELKAILGNFKVYHYSNDEVIDYLLQDIEYQNREMNDNKKNNLQKLLYKLDIEYQEDLYKLFFDDGTNDRLSLYNILHNNDNDVTIEEFKNILIENLNKKLNTFLYKFTFSDECGGISSALMSGEVFNNVDDEHITQTEFR